jgi:tol-pal system protein YbgF
MNSPGWYGSEKGGFADRGTSKMTLPGRLAGWGLICLVVAAGPLGCATRDQFLRLQKNVLEVRRVLADTQSDVQAQRRQLEALLGQSEVLQRTGSFKDSDKGVSLEARVAALEAAVGGRPVPGPAGEAPAAESPAGDAGVAAPAVPGAAGQELAALEGEAPGEDEYRMALALVQQENFAEAIPRLRSYLRKHPDTPLSDNAQYWIGESYYAQRDFNNAILAFYDVTRRYPKGDKVCAAMLKQGFAFAELGDAADARIVLERLIQAHPDCGEVVRARAKLASLRQG